jgi:hypothetical protein
MRTSAKAAGGLIAERGARSGSVESSTHSDMALPGMAAQVAARQRYNRFREKLGRYIAGHANDADRRRKAMTALTAKMARVAHTVAKQGHNTGRSSSDRTPGGRTPLCKCRECAKSDTVDNVRAFHLGGYPVLRTVRTTADQPADGAMFAWQGRSR